MTDAPDERLLDAIGGILDALSLATEYIDKMPTDRRFDDDARRLVLDRAAEAIEVIRQVTGEAE